MAASEKEKAISTSESLLEEHRELRELMETICATSDLSVMLPLLDELKDELKEHFATEEAPGGFGTVVSESAPHKASVVDHLFAEHKEFLISVQRLHEAVENCLAGPVAEVRTAAALLKRRLRKHEAQENELLSDSLYTDLGGG